MNDSMSPVPDACVSGPRLGRIEGSAGPGSRSSTGMRALPSIRRASARSLWSVDARTAEVRRVIPNGNEGDGRASDASPSFAAFREFARCRDSAQRLANSQLQHSRAERVRVDGNQSCRAFGSAHAPTTDIERMPDGRALRFLQRHDFATRTRDLGDPSLIEKPIHLENRIARQDTRALEHISELADIAWPGIA